ncbi:MAG: xanthine dehydrogenase family protein molybdopterin-binding subunit [Nitrospiraceae bacterium]|nr:xanthine dehydrogenase family protein molybdopterin-binding subunit [Nitrospiraceae bacterium]
MKGLTRREFIKYSLAGAGFAIALTITPNGYRILKAEEAEADSRFHPNLWISIAEDGRVTIIINKSEMGQGVSTALPMTAADELDANWRLVSFVEAPAGPEYRDPVMGLQLTGGSSSVKDMYKPFRMAGAAARTMLISAAARTWSVPEGECEAVSGTVRQAKTGRVLTYGELVKKASALPVPQKPALKKTSQFTFIGRPLARLDIPDKVNGAAVFGMDISVPGMLYAGIARPPAYGAKPLSYNREAALKSPGVVKVFPVPHGIAVVADGIEDVWKAIRALNVKWDKGASPELDNKTLRKSFIEGLDKRGPVALDRGDAAKAFLPGAAHVRIEAAYMLPYLAHVTMEPMDCTAHVRQDRCDIWVPTQNQTGVLQSAARITGLQTDRIHVHTTYLGGGFGRRGDFGYATEAVQISKLAGAPVKLIWSRPEDIKYDTFRPGQSCRIEGAVDSGGRLISWSHKVVVPSIFEHFAPQMMKGGIDPAAVSGIVDMDYEIPNLHVEWVKLENPIPIGFWRSVGNSHNGFTIESFMDELAHAANRDPVEFRLAQLVKKRHLPAMRLIETAAEKAGWGKPPKKGQAMGIAYHFSFGTRVAQVAEVSVDEKKGSITVHKVVCAIDCGPVAVNPSILTAQATGGIIMGLSAALGERIDFKNGGTITSNFYNYRELRISHAPEIEVHILKNQKTMGGVGEPPLPPIAPAVANAVFAATGKRIRNLPLEPELKGRL